MYSTSYFSLTVGRFLIQFQAEARMKNALKKKKKTLVSILIIPFSPWNEPMQNIWNSIPNTHSSCLFVIKEVGWLSLEGSRVDSIGNMSTGLSHQWVCSGLKTLLFAEQYLWLMASIRYCISLGIWNSRQAPMDSQLSF